MQNIIYEKTLQRRLKELEKLIVIPAPEVKTAPFSFHNSIQPENRINFIYDNTRYFLSIMGPQDPNDPHKYTHATSIVLMKHRPGTTNTFNSLLTYDPRDHVFDLWRCSTYDCLQDRVIPIHIILTIIRRLFPDLDVKTDIQVKYTLTGQEPKEISLQKFLKMVEKNEEENNTTGAQQGGIPVDNIPFANLPPYIAPIFMMPSAYIVGANDTPTPMQLTQSKKSRPSSKTMFQQGVLDIDALYINAKRAIQETRVDDDNHFNNRVKNIQSKIAKLYIEIQKLPSLPLTSLLVKDVRTNKKDAVTKLREVLNLFIELHERHNKYVVDQQLDGLLDLEIMTENARTLPTMEEIDIENRIKKLKPRFGGKHKK